MNNNSTWEFGTRQVVYGAIGAALYGALSWATNFFPLPAAGNITFRPAVAVLIFFGVAYGPWVGFLAGLIGNGRVPSVPWLILPMPLRRTPSRRSEIARTAGVRRLVIPTRAVGTSSCEGCQSGRSPPPEGVLSASQEP